MVRYVLRRIVAIVPILIGTSLLVFLILKLVPGDPARMLVGENARAEDIENVRQYLNLDDPLYVQYGKFISRAVQGDLGQSYRSRRPVVSEIAARLPATLELAAVGFAVSLVIGMTMGILSATRQYSLWDNLAMVIALLGISLPVYWLGLMLIRLFSVNLHWVPTSGHSDWRSLILPAGTLGFSSAAVIARQTRSAMLEVLHQDYIRTARSKGLGERIVITRHALKNAAVPTVTVLGLQFGHMLGGVVITEMVFGWPGMGRLLVASITFRDIPMVQGIVLLFATAIVLINLVTDILYGFLDPRIKLT